MRRRGVALRRHAQPCKFETAQRFRDNPAPGEAEIWQRLRLLQYRGYRFGRQKILLGWIVDFWCPSRRLIVEIDGGYHQSPEQIAKDRLRDKVLAEKLKAKTIRFTVEQVEACAQDVVCEIAKVARSRPVFKSWNQGLARIKPVRSVAKAQVVANR